MLPSRFASVSCAFIIIVPVRKFLWVLAYVVLSCGHFPHAYGETTEAIFAAWHNYDNLMETAHFECLLERTEEFAMSVHEGGDPYAPSEHAPQLVTLQSDLTVYFSDTKVAYTREGDFWDRKLLKPMPRNQFFGFDGKQNWSFLSNPDLSLGEIEDGLSPIDAIYNHLELKSIWLACTPIKYLNQAGYKIADAVIAEGVFTYEGSAALKLIMPSRAAGGGELTVYVDIANDFRILGISTSYKGVLRKDTTLSYEDNDEIKWVLGSWRSNVFRASGDVRLTLDGKVNNVIINEPLADLLFVPVFPVGTHVRTPNGTFLQQADGKMDSIEEERFAKHQ